MENGLKWYIIKATYGREKQGAEYLTSKGIRSISPSVTKIKTTMRATNLLKSIAYPTCSLPMAPSRH